MQRKAKGQTKVGKSRAVSASGNARPKRVTYNDQLSKHERKAQRRQKHTKDALQILKNLLATKGSEDAETIEAMEDYVEKSINAAQYLLDKNEHEEAGRVLEDAVSVIKDEVHASYPKLLFRISYRQAELQNARGLHQESLVYLRQAVAMAEEQESIDGDPLACLPAETYLNMAVALQYGERLNEAVEAANKAGKASQRALLALSEIQRQPKGFRNMKVQESQEQLMVQTDIHIQSHLVQGQILEKMRKYAQASEILQAGKRLLEQNFGAQHPLMSEFNQVEHQVAMQVAPTAFDPKRGPVSSHGGDFVENIDARVELGSENISALLDKRSDLMKRGRVKRIFYQVTDDVHVTDGRTDFADLEELEEKEAEQTMNNCAQTQQGWMQRQQLMAMRQQQDEQFRMMELLISTRQGTHVECSHPQVYVPQQYSYPMVQQQQVLETESSSSEPSDTTSEESRQPSTVQSEKSRTPSPVSSEKIASSVSSKSDSFECQSMNLGEMQNFQSEDSDSDVENPPQFIERTYDPITAEQKKPIRQSGREFAFKEKNFKSGIYLTKRKIVTSTSNTPPPVAVVVQEQPLVDEEWVRLSFIIYLQARIRRFLRIRRRRSDTHFGLVCPTFYIKHEMYRFKITIYKVEVAHTVKRKKTRHERTRVRHHNESEMNVVSEKVEEKEAETHTRMIIMYQVVFENIEGELGESSALIPLVDFPAEFPYLIDYMRASLTIELVQYKGRNFRVHFTKLTWEREQEIVESIKRIIINIDNRTHRHAALRGAVLSEEEHSSIEISMVHSGSFKSQIQEIDFDAIRSKLDAAQKEGHDMEALRHKVQWEARQLLERQLVTSQEVRLIVPRDYRQSHEQRGRDHIRLNHFRPVHSLKLQVKQRPSLNSIIKVQAMIRGFLARRNKQRGPTWLLMFDFVVNIVDDYFLVRTYRAPESCTFNLSLPYQVVVTRYMQPTDSFKLRLEQLPYEGDECHQLMIKNIVIVVDSSQQRNIQEVSFKALPKQKKIKVAEQDAVGSQRILQAAQPVEETKLIEEEVACEFIDDWELPDEKRTGRFEIRKFTKHPYLIITFGYEQTEKNNFYYVHVLYVARPNMKSEHEIHLNKLPVRLNAMMYFLRRYLKVYFTSDKQDRLDYAAIQNFGGQQAFEWEMDRLRKTLKKDAKVDTRLQQALRKRLENKRSDLEAAALNCYEIPMHNNIYVVKVINGPEREEGIIVNDKDRKKQWFKPIKYSILVYRKDDRDDSHQIYVHSEKFYSREEMFKHVREHMRIYINEETNMIQYAAITQICRGLEHVHEEIKEIKYDIELVVKMQSVVRRWLVLRRMKRDFEGMITKFVMKDDEHKGRCVSITVWKTLVEHTRKTKKTQKIKQRDSKGNVQHEEVKQTGEEEIVREQIEAYQIVAQNLYLDDNHHEKIVIKIPPRNVLIEALREAIKLEWEGTFKHDIDDLKVDWLESISYAKLNEELLKRAQKKTLSQVKDYSRYNLRVGLENKWDEKASYPVGNTILRMLEAMEVTNLDDKLVQIVAHPRADSSDDDEGVKLAEITLTVREVLSLMRRSLTEDQMAVEPIDELAMSVSYSKKHDEWELLLRECCSVLSTGVIFIDEMIFQSKRYGFDPSQAREDAKACTAVILMQKYVRKHLAKRRQFRLMRTPGYATSTGVFIEKEIYLVYILSASKNQAQFRLTLKQRNVDGSREPILEKHAISDQIAEQAIISYTGMFKLQSVTKMFAEKILNSHDKAIFQNGQGDRNVNWKEDLVSAIKQDF